MSVDPSVATIFSAQILENLDPAHVWTEATNQNYEGEITGSGDVLKIFSVGRPTVNSYTVGTDLTYERIRPTNQVLAIDQDVDWAIAEDELEKMLSKINTMQELAKEGAWSLVDGSDQFLAKKMALYAGITSDAAQVGNGASDRKAYSLLELMTQQIKEAAGVHPMDLHAFVPYWFMTALRLDKRFTGFGTDMSQRNARGEQLVQLAGITIHETNNALDSAATGFDNDGPINTIIVASKKATTWGRLIPEQGLVQVLGSEINPTNFDNRMRARYTYGATVVYPQLIAKCKVTKGNLDD